MCADDQLEGHSVTDRRTARKVDDPLVAFLRDVHKGEKVRYLDLLEAVTDELGSDLIADIEERVLAGGSGATVAAIRFLVP